jgi:hypothetical protein
LRALRAAFFWATSSSVTTTGWSPASTPATYGGGVGVGPPLPEKTVIGMSVDPVKPHDQQTLLLVSCTPVAPQLMHRVTSAGEPN